MTQVQSRYCAFADRMASVDHRSAIRGTRSSSLTCELALGLARYHHVPAYAPLRLPEEIITDVTAVGQDLILRGIKISFVLPPMDLRYVPHHSCSGLSETWARRVGAAADHVYCGASCICLFRFLPHIFDRSSIRAGAGIEYKNGGRCTWAHACVATDCTPLHCGRSVRVRCTSLSRWLSSNLWRAANDQLPVPYPDFAMQLTGPTLPYPDRVEGVNQVVIIIRTCQTGRLLPLMDPLAWTRRSALIEAAEDDSDTMPDICSACVSLDGVLGVAACNMAGFIEWHVRRHCMVRRCVSHSSEGHIG